MNSREVNLVVSEFHPHCMYNQPEASVSGLCLAV